MSCYLNLKFISMCTLCCLHFLRKVWKNQNAISGINLVLLHILDNSDCYVSAYPETTKSN